MNTTISECSIKGELNNYINNNTTYVVCILFLEMITAMVIVDSPKNFNKLTMDKFIQIIQTWFMMAFLSVTPLDKYYLLLWPFVVSAILLDMINFYCKRNRSTQNNNVE
jgi:uncharacterized membrane protein